MNAELMPVQFYGDTVFLVKHNKEPHPSIRPIANNMRVDWESRFRKLTGNKKFFLQEGLTSS